LNGDPYMLGLYNGMLLILTDDKSDYQPLRCIAQQPAQESITTLLGAAQDVLAKLIKFRALDDGDLPSKSGMNDLIKMGLAEKDYSLPKPNVITAKGLLFPSAQQPAQEPVSQFGSKELQSMILAKLSKPVKQESKSSITDEQIENIIYQCDGFLKWGVGEHGKQTIREKIRGILGEV